MGNHHGLETGRKCGFNSKRIKRTCGPGSLLHQEVRRRREETAWKQKKIEASVVIVMFMRRVMTYVVSKKLFWNCKVKIAYIIARKEIT